MLFIFKTIEMFCRYKTIKMFLDIKLLKCFFFLDIKLLILFSVHSKLNYLKCSRNEMLRGLLIIPIPEMKLWYFIITGECEEHSHLLTVSYTPVPRVLERKQITAFIGLSLTSHLSYSSSAWLSETDFHRSDHRRLC